MITTELLAEVREQYERELWLPIPGYETEYAISDLGRHWGLPRHVRTRSARGGVEGTRFVPGGLRTAMHRAEGDRWRIKLSHNNLFEHFDLAGLVLTTFYGPAPSPNHYAKHVDGNVNNNRLTNLRWALRETTADAA